MDGATVDRLALHLQNALPQYVPYIPSRNLGLFWGLILAVVVSLLGLTMGRFKFDAEFGMWTVMGLVLGVAVAVIVSNYDFKFKSFMANKQHYTNLVWIERYLKALRPTIPLLGGA